MSYFSIPALAGISQNPKRWREAIGGIRMETPGSFDSIESIQLGSYPETSNYVNKPQGINLKAWQYRLGSDGIDRRNWTNELPLNGLVMVKRHGVTDPQPDPTECKMLGLPQWHHQMHMEALEDARRGIEDEAEMQTSISNILTNWTLMGVNSASKPLKGGESNARTVAIFKKGIQQVVNYWGAGVVGGQYLFLVLKYVPVDVNTTYTTNIDGTQTLTPGIFYEDAAKKQKRISYVPRLVPVIGYNKETPEWKDLHYTTVEEDVCVHRFGLPFYIGYCDWNRDMASKAAPLDPTHRFNPIINARNQQICGLVDVIVDIFN